METGGTFTSINEEKKHSPFAKAFSLFPFLSHMKAKRVSVHPAPQEDKRCNKLKFVSKLFFPVECLRVLF